MIDLHLSTGQEALVHCAHCGFECVHLDDAHIAAVEVEDGPTTEIHVSSTGAIDVNTPVPTGEGGLGRRHTIAVSGWCEGCGKRFAYSFKQHKGSTYLYVVPLEGEAPLG